MDRSLIPARMVLQSYVAQRLPLSPRGEKKTLGRIDWALGMRVFGWFLDTWSNLVEGQIIIL